MSSDLHVLWKDDALPVYVMDNHRAAMWCWMREVTRSSPYAFVHLDYHWDAASDAVQHLPVLERHHGEMAGSLEVFDRLHPPSGSWGAQFPIIRWDNYIQPFLLLYPHATCVHLSACQGEEGWDIEELLASIHDRIVPTGETRVMQGHTPEDLIARLPEVLRSSSAKAIVNVDLDMFASGRPRHEDDTSPPAVPREGIAPLFCTLRNAMERIAAVTIALSPECSGGWELAIDACGTACDAMQIANPFKQLLSGAG